MKERRIDVNGIIASSLDGLSKGQGRRGRHPACWEHYMLGIGRMLGVLGFGADLLAAVGLLPAGGLVPSSAACCSELRTLLASPTTRMNARR